MKQIEPTQQELDEIEAELIAAGLFTTAEPEPETEFSRAFEQALNPDVTIYTTCPKCGQEMRWSYRSGLNQGEPMEDAHWIGICDDFLCEHLDIVDDAAFEYDQPELLYQSGIFAVEHGSVPSGEMRTLEAMGEAGLTAKLRAFVHQNVRMA